MNTELVINVSAIVGGPYAVAVEDGQRIYENITPLLRNGQKVTLSFEGIKTTIPPFLSAAVGQLHKEFEEDSIQELLSVVEMKESDVTQLYWAVENTRRYLKDPRAYDQAWKEVMGDDE